MWCLSCNTPLSHSEVAEDERKQCFSPDLVFCQDCYELHSESSDRRSWLEFRRNEIDENLDDVIHEAAIALNIPSPSKNLYKRCDRTIGTTLESFAEGTIQKAIESEKSLTQQSHQPRGSTPVQSSANLELDDSIVNLVATYDIGRQSVENDRSSDNFTGLHVERDLKGEFFSEDHGSDIIKFADNAYKISPCGSSQPNEYLNTFFSCETPKRQRVSIESVREVKDGIQCVKDKGLISAEEMSSSVPRSDDFEVVYFDLETTGFGEIAEICQIAAIHQDRVFSEYTVPVNGISPFASNVHGLTVKDNVLYKDNSPLETLSLRECLIKFLEFLYKLNKPVILSGHNIIRFDCNFLFRDMNNCNLSDKFFAIVKGLLDTFPMLKCLIPGRKSYKLVNLALDYLSEEECQNAHDAVYDVKMLDGIIRKMRLNSDTLHQHSITVPLYIEQREKQKEIKHNILTLDPCVGVLSAGIIKKLATCRLNLSQLLDTYKASGDEGIITLVSQEVDGKPLVTKNKRIIRSLLTFLQNYK